MGRPKKQNREPFWRSDRSCYYVQHGTKQVRLSPDKDEAWRLWHEFMARPPEQAAPVIPSGPSAQVVEILDLFLEWVSRNNAPRTYAWYVENIQPFATAIPAGLKVSDLKPYHLTVAMDTHPDWGNNTKYNFIGATKRAFKWAHAQGLIDSNPIVHMSKPSREACDTAISPAEYQKIIAVILSPDFRDLIEFTWECGCRPQEIRKIEARFFDGSRIVFPPKEAKGKKYYRVIYLTPRACEIVARLAEERPEGPIFLNEDGNPWNKNAINCVFHRMQKRVGKKYHLGAFRKGYATEALKAGVDVVGLAHLLGHRDTSMLARTYAKVQQDQEYMASLAQKAKGPRPDSTTDAITKKVAEARKAAGG